MDLADEIRNFLYEQGQLTEECQLSDDCRHIVDHPIWDGTGYVSRFTCYNARAFAAGLAAHLERRHREDEEMRKVLADAQHRTTQARLTADGTVIYEGTVVGRIDLATQMEQP